VIFQPDPVQQAVLDHVRGPLLVNGGPGTGKTAVLRERFARGEIDEQEYEARRDLLARP